MRHMPGTKKPAIYIGNIDDANNKDWLSKCNIKAILNVCNDIESMYYSDFVYAKWGLDDPKTGLAERNNVGCAVKVLDMLCIQAKRLKGNVLVHCAAGHNRSALVVGVWASRNLRKYNFREAVKAAQVKDKKPWMIDKGYIW